VTTQRITWFSSSPSAGDPGCICSWCEEPIGADEAPIIRLFDSDTNREARFHRFCTGPALGITMPVPQDLEDDI
jgi:hypothetical protein